MFIDTIDPDDADGKLESVYADVLKKRGKISRILKVQSLNPESLKTHLDFYHTLLFGRSGLFRAERELIAVVVSAENGCAYCTAHHGEALKAYWKDDERVQQVSEDFSQADLSDREAEMLQFAVKLTRNPSAMEEANTERLREVGFSDRDILDITMIVGYFNFVNRLAEGLGVEHDPEEVKGYSY